MSQPIRGLFYKVFCIASPELFLYGCGLERGLYDPLDFFFIYRLPSSGIGLYKGWNIS